MIVLFVLLAAAAASAQQFTNQEQAMAMAEQSFDSFLQRVMAQVDLAMAQAREAFPADAAATTSDDGDVHYAVAKPLDATPSASEAVESVKVVIESLQRAVARGSALYNAGEVELCARLYFQTVAQVAQVLSELGEADAAAFLTQVLVQSSQAGSANDAAWMLRGGIERLVAAIRAAPQYASLFAAPTAPAGESDATCGFGLLIQRVGDELRVYETRSSVGCDDDIDVVDAIFFVDESSSSSSSSENQPVVVDDQNFYSADDASNDAAQSVVHQQQPVEPQQKHSMLRSVGMCAVLGMACAVLVLMVAWRRRLQKIRRLRAQIAAAQQQKRVFGAPVSLPVDKSQMALNFPYANLV